MKRASNDYIYLTRKDEQVCAVDDIRIPLNNHSKSLYYSFGICNAALYYILVFFRDYDVFMCILLFVVLQHIAIEY